MSFRKALSESEKQRGGVGSPHYCKLSELAESMDGADFDAFEEALDNTLVSSRQITRALNTEGFTVGLSTVLKHRNRKCACFSETVDV